MVCRASCTANRGLVGRQGGAGFARSSSMPSSTASPRCPAACYSTGREKLGVLRVVVCTQKTLCVRCPGTLWRLTPGFGTLRLYLHLPLLHLQPVGF